MSAPLQPLPQEPPYIIILLFGVVLVASGTFLKQSYEQKDLLRTKSEKRSINAITGYRVTYRSLGYSDTVYNEPIKSIKPVGYIHFFNTRGKKTPAPIISVSKEAVSQIEVVLEDGRKALISQSNFTEDITEEKVGTQIDIEYDPNDLTNVSMKVEGLTVKQWWGCWSIISIGTLMIIVYLLILFGIIKTP